mmetsp:Transcript_33375/g.76633  ORF Transcript_33375/g.76633 Transcript_33375/m.76633 type:complete len:348 (+) Transcript_33375:391-1434(+)
MASTLHQSHVSTVGPHLSGGFAVIPPTQNVISGRQRSWNLQHVQNRYRGEFRASITVAALAFLTVWCECWHWIVVAPRTVAPRGTRARLTRPVDQVVFPRLAPRTHATWAEPGRRDGEHGPRGARRARAFVDEHPFDGQSSAVGEDEGLPLPHELERVCLEARLAQRRARRAKPVLIPAAVVVSDLPCHLNLAATCPRRRRVVWERAERAPPHPVVCERRVDVHPFLRHVRSPRRTACEATCVGDRCAPGRTPRVVAVDVELGAGRGVAVDGAVRGVVHRGLLPAAAHVRLHTATLMVACRAADETSLRVPERGLAVEAARAREVGARLFVYVDKVIDRVAAPRADQ